MTTSYSTTIAELTMVDCTAAVLSYSSNSFKRRQYDYTLEELDIFHMQGVRYCVGETVYWRSQLLDADSLHQAHVFVQHLHC